MGDDNKQTAEDMDIPQEALDALNYDPFDGSDLNPSDSSGVASDGKDVSEESATSTASDGTDGDASPEQDKAPEGEPEPQKEEKTAQKDDDFVLNEGMLALLQTGSQSQPPQPEQPKAPSQSSKSGPESSTDDLPPYEFNIPPQLMAMLGSEDLQERTQAVQSMFKGTCQAVHKTVMEAVVRKISEARQEITSSVQADSVSRAAATEIHNDYYGNFPTHNNPAIKPLVQRIAVQMQQQTGASGWSPDLRNSIGNKVNELLRQAGVLQQNSPANSTKAPPRATGQGTRAGGKANSRDHNSEQEITDFLFGS